MRRSCVGLAVLAIALVTSRGAFAGDRETAQGIAEALRSSGRLTDYSIGVSYKDGTAWLYGRVSTEEQMAEAIAMAQQLPEVTRVVNKLAIGASPTQAAGQPAGRPAVQLAPRGSERLSEAQAVQPVAYPQPAPQQRPAQGAPRVRRPAPLPAAPAQPLAQRGLPPRGEQAGNPQPRRYAPQLSQRAVPVQAVEAAPSPQGEYDGYESGPMYQGGPTGAPLPIGGVGVAPPPVYDQPYMPNYAWPSYAAYPNYAGVTYPKQYSPSAWPYIGPFYPYPQVPLGWRRVTLEWDDGWWFLDFDDRATRRSGGRFR